MVDEWKSVFLCTKEVLQHVFEKYLLEEVKYVCLKKCLKYGEILISTYEDLQNFTY